jgi:hypothetical protein
MALPRQAITAIAVNGRFILTLSFLDLQGDRQNRTIGLESAAYLTIAGRARKKPSSDLLSVVRCSASRSYPLYRLKCDPMR